MEEEKYCVYGHYTDAGQVFYVGIGDAKRPYRFDSDRRSEFWTRYVKKHCASEKPTVKIWHSNLTWEKACEKEKMWIALFGRRDVGTGCLVNMTDGGEGAVGAVRSPEAKMKLAEAKRGKKRSPETKLKVAEANRGKKRSPETKLKMSKAQRGKKRGEFSEGHKRRLSEANRGKGKGYYFHKKSQKWLAYIGIGGKRHHLGLFKTEAEAADAYKDALEKSTKGFQK